MGINFGVNYPIDRSGFPEEFIDESGVDFLVVPSESDRKSVVNKKDSYDYRNILNKVKLFMKDYDNPSVVKSEEFMENLAHRLINSADLGGSGFFAPPFISDTEVYDPLFRTIFAQTSARYDVIFPFWDNDVFFDIFESIRPSKFKIHAQPSELVGVDRLDDIYENIQHLSFPLIRNGNLDGDIDREEYFNVIENIYYESFYDDIYVFIHLVPKGSSEGSTAVKKQARSFKKAKRDISTVLETIIGEDI